MNDHDALLRAIVENPAEDTPRLVFADWLDENADTFPTPAVVRQRAAFIRDDIAMSQRDEFDPPRLRWELIEKPQRETEAWVKETLPNLPEGYDFISEPRFRRGFLSGVILDSKYRRALPEPPVDQSPIACLRFFACSLLGIELLRRVGWRSRIMALEFARGGRTSLTDFHSLFALDNLACLERLAFLEHTIDRRELDRLVTSAMFSRLVAVTITYTPVGNAFVESFNRLGTPIALRELQLRGCRIAPSAVAQLLVTPAAKNLKSLSFGGDRIGTPEKFHSLSRVSTPPLIRSLDMSNDTLNEGGLELFLTSPLVPGLQRLILSDCGLNRTRASLIADGMFDSLRVLDLSCNPIGNDSAVAIANSPHFAGLRVLELSHSQVGDEGIEAILDSPLAENLVLLDLRGSPASAEMKEVLKAKMGDRVRV